MTLTEISNTRLISQRIEMSEFKTVNEIVSWMGAMQAQDYLMSKWAIGTRLLNSTEATVEDAIDKGEIIRTHLMRPTSHYVSSDDIHWMLALTAPQIKSSMKSRHLSLELSEDIVSKSKQLVENALQQELISPVKNYPLSLIEQKSEQMKQIIPLLNACRIGWNNL